jgi:hypothetical protein
MLLAGPAVAQVEPCTFVAGKLLASDGAAYERFGAAVAAHGRKAVVGAPDVGAAYVFGHGDVGWLELARLEGETPGALDEFGRSVAVDGEVVLVGAPSDATLGAGRGAAWVFRRAGSSWVREVRLLASDGVTERNFGERVAVDGGVVAVAAPREYAGAVYVFERSGTTWVERQKLLAPTPPDEGSFGAALALDGDWIAVGGHTVTSEPWVDVVDLFAFDGSAWVHDATLNAPDTPANGFGGSVDLHGPDLLVGAWADSEVALIAGAAYVFVRRSGAWLFQDKLIASDAAAFDFAGESVGLHGGRAVVGAPGDNFDRGAAYLFARAGTDWSEVSKLVGKPKKVGDLFGDAVAVDGDLVLAGVPYDDDLGEDSGSAFAFVVSEVDVICAPAGGAPCAPHIGFSGHPSAADPLPFDIRAAEVPARVRGLLVWGHRGGRPPLVGGALCVRPPLRLTPLQFSGGSTLAPDCSGAFDYDFNTLVQSGTEPALVPGARVFAQYAFRRRGGPLDLGVTDALVFTICD